MKEKLHWISGSPNAWRVMLFMAIKNIEYESIRIEPKSWDRDTSGFYDLNPRGKVPLLEDGDNVVYESLAIMSYLEAKYPESPLFGIGHIQSGLVWQRIAELVHYAIEPMYLLSRSLMRGQALEKVSESNETAQTISLELASIESWLTNCPYFAGESLTAADIYFYPAIAFLKRISYMKANDALDFVYLPLEEKFPKLDSWMKRIEEISVFDKTIPPHWKGE